MSRPRGRNSHTPKARLERADDAIRATKLILAGMTMRDISRILDCSVSTAHKYVAEGRKTMAFEAKTLIEEVVARERALIKTHWKSRRDPESAKVVHASDKIILSALPQRTELSGPDGGPIVTSAVTPAEARKIMSELFPGNVGPGDDGGPPEGAPSE